MGGVGAGRSDHSFGETSTRQAKQGGRRFCRSPDPNAADSLDFGEAVSVNVQLLIDSIVRQTTVLIAQLATAGGARAPLAHVANQVFLDLVRELDQQGVSRKVGADMFGLALRSYQRKIQRVGESRTDQGRSLWEAVFAYLEREKIATRTQVLGRFHRDDDQLVRGVLHDLTESGLLFSSGIGEGTVYRIATREDLLHVRVTEQAEEAASLDAMVWAVVYRDGPIGRDALIQRVRASDDILAASLDRLERAGRIERNDMGSYGCRRLEVPYGSSTGWEAAVFDHFQSVVKTICIKLRLDKSSSPRDTIGGSTYTFVVWDGHPLEDEALLSLKEFRKRSDELRTRIDTYNAEHDIPESHRKVTSYGGQCVIEEEPEK